MKMMQEVSNILKRNELGPSIKLIKLLKKVSPLTDDPEVIEDFVNIAGNLIEAQLKNQQKKSSDDEIKKFSEEIIFDLNKYSMKSMLPN